MAKGSPYVQCNFPIGKKMKAKLAKLAKEHDTTQSAILREALKRELKRLEGRK